MADLLSICAGSPANCAQFVDGVLEAARVIQANEDRGAEGRLTVLCRPLVRHSASDLVARIRSRIEELPGEADKPAALLIIQAANDAAPC
ncbi:hypothetical protein ACFOGJ_17410 [Marinibaculum pumilum]|uniref:Rap1a immunity protein domain-containing protein n=1 Tax=Marinibaculum pumilum TaxID=1766165 RepID=A0ABV7L343_9PROT